jgi:hypothetical protein
MTFRNLRRFERGDGICDEDYQIPHGLSRPEPWLGFDGRDFFQMR